MFVLTAVVVSGMTAFQSWELVNHHGRAILLQVLPQPLILISLAVPVGVILILIAVSSWENGVLLYEKGLALYRGKRFTVLPWDKIIRMDAEFLTIKLAGHPFQKRTRMIFEDEFGKVYRIPDRYADMTELVQAVRQRLLPLLFARAQKTLQKNQTLLFHPLLLAQANGLLIRNNHCAWQAVVAPVIDKGKLKIMDRKTGQILFQEKTSRIRNLDLLRHLISIHHSQ